MTKNLWKYSVSYLIKKYIDWWKQSNWKIFKEEILIYEIWIFVKWSKIWWWFKCWKMSSDLKEPWDPSQFLSTQLTISQFYKIYLTNNLIQIYIFFCNLINFSLTFNLLSILLHINFQTIFLEAENQEVFFVSPFNGRKIREENYEKHLKKHLIKVFFFF